MNTPGLPEQLAATQSTWFQRHGNSAQWAGFAISLVMLLLVLYFHYNESQSKASDEHVNTLIGDKLQPAIKTITDDTDRKFSSVTQQLTSMGTQIGELRGLLGHLSDGQKNVNDRVVMQAEILDKLQDPIGALSDIRARLESAKQKRKPINREQLVSYKNVVRLISPAMTGYNYWETVETIINYQSFVNQTLGKAPDPEKVSRPCGPATGGLMNVISGQLSDCIITLDTQVFANTTFQDSVVIYKGGPTSLLNVRFINCRFVLELPPSYNSAREPVLLATLFESPDQTDVRVSTHQ
jgi:hypothetical protein